jgi:hypothetical protein
VATDPENLLEAHIHDFLEANITALLEDGAKVIERESVLPFGRIDLLCEDGYGDLVAVEVKRGLVGRDAIGQLLAYLGGLRERNPDRHVRGVLVGETLDAAAAAALKAVPDLDFISYQVSFTLTPVHKGPSSKPLFQDTPAGRETTLNLKTKFRLLGPLDRFVVQGRLPMGLTAEKAFRRLFEWIQTHDYGWHIDDSQTRADGALSVGAVDTRGRSIGFVVRADSLELNFSGLPRYVRSLVPSEKRELAWLKH